MENRMMKSLCIFDQNHPLDSIYKRREYQHLLFWSFGGKHTFYSVHEQLKVIHLETQDAKKVFQELEGYSIKSIVMFMDDEVGACYWGKQLKAVIVGAPILLVIRQPSMSDRVFHEYGIRVVVRSNGTEPLFMIRNHFNEE